MPEVVANWASIAINVLYTKLNTSKEGKFFQNIFLPGTWVTAVGMLYINQICSVWEKTKNWNLPPVLKSILPGFWVNRNDHLWLTAKLNSFEWNTLATVSERGSMGHVLKERGHSCILTKAFPVFLGKGSCLQIQSPEKQVQGSGWIRGPVQLSTFLLEPDL